MRKYLAEFLGTLVLVLFACGTAAALGVDGKVPDGAYFMTALSFGLVIVAMAYSIGNISGCHINPAVSLGMLLSGRLEKSEFFGYIISQFLGAIVGTAILVYLLGVDSGLGANALYEGDVVKSLIIEIILSFVFVLSVIGATTKFDNASVAGLVIGLSLTLVHILGIHFTGTSVNPARSFGPALFVGGQALADVWVFIVAPLIGGVLASLCYTFLEKE